MIKNVNDAYEHSMHIIEKLKSKGIEIDLIVPRIIRESDNPDIDLKDLISRYSQPERLHWSKWRHVQIKSQSLNDQSKIDLVRFSREYLVRNGIMFDSGSGCGSIDWEIDWSFHWEKRDNWDENKEKLYDYFLNFAQNCKTNNI